MATEILANGTTTATSSNVVIPSGATKIVALKTSGVLPPRGYAWVVVQTGGTVNFVEWLDSAEPQLCLEGGATYNVKRLAYSGDAFGAVIGD